MAPGGVSVLLLQVLLHDLLLPLRVRRPKDEEEHCMGTDVESAGEAEGKVGRLWGQVREIASFRRAALPHRTDQAAPIELHESANGHKHTRQVGTVLWGNIDVDVLVAVNCNRTSLRVRYFLVGFLFRFLFRARADRSFRALDALVSLSIFCAHLSLTSRPSLPDLHTSVSA